MSRNPSGVRFVEGVHCFNIEAGYEVCRIECSSFYSRQAQNFCGGCKEMDFLLYNPQKADLWLVEVKDYRFDARPKVLELVNALTRKVRDTLFLLKAAAIKAPDETPPEGLSLKEFAMMAAGAKTLHLGFLLEMGMSGVWSDGGILANVKNMLVASMRFLDADLVCAPITYPGRIGPWCVTPAEGQVSKRIEIRRTKHLAEIQEARRRQREANLKNGWGGALPRHSAEHKSEPEQEPQWKRRLQMRMNGEPTSHEARRAKKKQKSKDDA